MHVPKHLLIVISLFICSTAFATAQNLPRAARAEDVGFSADRMGRVTRFFQSEVDKGAIPGVVLVVARDSKVAYTEAIGYQVHNTIMNRFENFLLYFVFQQIQERRFVSL